MTALPPVDELLDTLERKLRACVPPAPLLVGVHTGGAWLAERLHRRLGLAEPCGTLDIALHRDDFERVGLAPTRVTRLPVDLDERHVLLVDDVLHTGRTTRAALNALFDYGRPRSVMLAVLVERDGRELPIQADAVGMHLKLGPRQYLKLFGPDPLELRILEKPL
jgi:pyrimidine operon attenuation protein/uracil phosphoribosyltransferase